MSLTMSELEFGEPSRAGDEATFAVRVPADLRYLEGHFPGDPIVPGVAQIVALAEEPTRRVWPDLGPVAGLRRVKFTQAIRPTDSLKLQLIRSGAKVSFRVYKADGSECSRGTLVFRSAPADP